VYPQDGALEEICSAGEQISRKQTTFSESLGSRDVTATNRWQSNPILFPIYAKYREISHHSVARRGFPSFSSRNEERAKRDRFPDSCDRSSREQQGASGTTPIIDRSLDRLGFSGGMRERTWPRTKTKCGKERDLCAPSR